MQGMRDILLREMDHADGTGSDASCRYPGHEHRIAAHTARIHTSPCECGSGESYLNCCLARDLQRSRATVAYTMPAPRRGVGQANQMEDALRFRAFSAFYRAGREEKDPFKRFAAALVASAGRILDPTLLARWQRQFSRRKAARKVRQ